MAVVSKRRLRRRQRMAERSGRPAVDARETPVRPTWLQALPNRLEVSQAHSLLLAVSRVFERLEDAGLRSQVVPHVGLHRHAFQSTLLPRRQSLTKSV